MGRRTMTAAQRVQAAIARVVAHAHRPEDNAHLTELYALAARHKRERALVVGRPGMRAHVQARHVRELLVLEARYSALNRAERARRYRSR